MRKRIITGTVIAASSAGAYFAENGIWLPAVGCIVWVFLCCIPKRKKKLRAASRSQKTEEPLPVKPLYSYSNTSGEWRQALDERWRA